MSLDPRTFVLGEHTYIFRPLGARAGRKLLTQLVQRFGKPLGAAVGTLQDASKLAAPVGEAIAGLCGQLDERFYEELVSTLAKQTAVELDGGERQLPLSGLIEEHFASAHFRELQWVGECLSVQYADFLDFLRRALAGDAQAKRMLGTLFGSPSKSTGGSTESQPTRGTAQG